jgi:hypothetical protein
MATVRRDYFVKDEFNDIWNVEPLPTFKQAHEFRGAILKDLNHPRTLRIESIVRGVREIVVEPIRTRADRHREMYASTSDF